MSAQDLILNFIIGVIASYLASEIRERPRYAWHTLKRLLDKVKALYYQAISKSTSKGEFILAVIKLNRNLPPKNFHFSRVTLFITSVFLITIISPFKVGEDIEHSVDNVSTYPLKWQQPCEHSLNLDSEVAEVLSSWAARAIVAHEFGHYLSKSPESKDYRY